MFLFSLSFQFFSFNELNIYFSKFNARVLLDDHSRFREIITYFPSKGNIVGFCQKNNSFFDYFSAMIICLHCIKSCLKNQYPIQVFLFEIHPPAFCDHSVNKSGCLTSCHSFQILRNRNPMPAAQLFQIPFLLLCRRLFFSRLIEKWFRHK